MGVLENAYAGFNRANARAGQNVNSDNTYVPKSLWSALFSQSEKKVPTQADMNALSIAASGPSAGATDDWATKNEGVPSLLTSPAIFPELPKNEEAPLPPNSNAGGFGAPGGTDAYLGLPKGYRSKYDALMKKLDARGKTSLEKQQAGLDDMQNLLKLNLGGKAQLDLSPLLSLADAWTGSNMAKNYDGRSQNSDQQKTILGLQQALQKGRNDLSENEVNLIKSQLGNEMQLAELEGRGADRKLDKEKNDAFKNANFELLKEQKSQNIRESMNKTKQSDRINGVMDMHQALNSYEDLVRKHGINATGKEASAINNAYEGLTLAFKKAGELGALSGPDMGILERSINRAGGLEAYWKQWASGGVPAILEQVGQMRRASKHSYDRDMSTLKSVYPKGAESIFSNYESQRKSLYRPELGEVVDGYKYKGGPLNDQNNWEPVK